MDFVTMMLLIPPTQRRPLRTTAVIQILYERFRHKVRQSKYTLIIRNIVYRKMTSYICIGLMTTGTLQETRKLIKQARWRIFSKINTIYAGHVNPSWIEAKVE